MSADAQFRALAGVYWLILVLLPLAFIFWLPRLGIRSRVIRCFLAIIVSSEVVVQCHISLLKSQTYKRAQESGYQLQRSTGAYATVMNFGWFVPIVIRCLAIGAEVTQQFRSRRRQVAALHL